MIKNICVISDMNITVGSPGHITELTCDDAILQLKAAIYIISHYLSRLTHMIGHGLYI